MALIDFHCHLDLYPDFEQTIEECEKKRVYTLAVTTTPQAWPRNRDLCLRTKYVRAALGLHPQLAGARWKEIDAWLRYLPESRYVGEVGLDAGPSHFRTLDRQKDVFRTVLQACASEGGKILSVHSVRAVTAVLDMIEEHLPQHAGTVVLHWFTGSASEAKRAAELGCYFSINGKMLQNPRGSKLVQSVPLDRILTETDGPFTDDGGQPLRPWNVVAAFEDLASCLGQNVRSLESALLANLATLTTSAHIDPLGSSPKPASFVCRATHMDQF